MKLNGNRPAFKAYGASVTGSKHVAAQKSNQDAYGWIDGCEGVEVMALSDGHGGSEHDLSELGSKFAVEAALQCAQSLVTDERIHSEMSLEALSWYFEEPFSQKIQETWTALIRTHSQDNDLRRYGCTLLMAIHWESWLVFLQIGDGKIAVVYENGQFYFPMPSDSRLAGNMTFSMAQRCAWAEMKIRIVPYDTSIHTVVLATDGVENAYPNGIYDDAEFYLWLASECPTETVVENGLLEAEHYSKDDSTVVIWRNLTKTFNILMPTDSEISEEIKILEAVNFEVESMAEICEWPINKRIEMAYSLMNHLDKEVYCFNPLNTLKSIVMDSKAHTFSWRGHQTEPCDVERILDLLSQLELKLDRATIVDHQKLKKALLDIQRRLKYNYVEHQFFLDDERTSYVLEIEGANGAFELFSDSVFYLHQVMPLLGNFDPVVGKIVQHSKIQGVWGLKNMTDHSWMYLQRQIAPNDILPLKDGICVWIYGLPANIRFKSPMNQKANNMTLI